VILAVMVARTGEAVVVVVAAMDAAMESLVMAWLMRISVAEEALPERPAAAAAAAVVVAALAAVVADAARMHVIVARQVRSCVEILHDLGNIAGVTSLHRGAGRTQLAPGCPLALACKMLGHLRT